MSAMCLQKSNVTTGFVAGVMFNNVWNFRYTIKISIQGLPVDSIVTNQGKMGRDCHPDKMNSHVICCDDSTLKGDSHVTIFFGCDFLKNMGPVRSIWLSAITVWKKLISLSLIWYKSPIRDIRPHRPPRTKGEHERDVSAIHPALFLGTICHGCSPGLWPFAALAGFKVCIGRHLTFHVFAPSTRTSSLKLEGGCRWHTACYVSWKHFAIDAAWHCPAGQRTFCRMFALARQTSQRGPSQRSSHSIIQSTKFTKAWVSILIERNPSTRERILLDVFELSRWPSKFDRKRIHSNPHLSSFSSTERGSIQTIASPPSSTAAGEPTWDPGVCTAIVIFSPLWWLSCNKLFSLPSTKGIFLRRNILASKHRILHSKRVKDERMLRIILLGFSPKPFWESDSRE